MNDNVPRSGPGDNEPTHGRSDVDDGERGYAFRGFHQAAACQSSAVLCMTATLGHVVESVLAAGGDTAELHAALDAWHRNLSLALDGALIDALARCPEARP